MSRYSLSMLQAGRAALRLAGPARCVQPDAATGERAPLQSGYFSLKAPLTFMEDAPRRFTVQWIDFYR